MRFLLDVVAKLRAGRPPPSDSLAGPCGAADLASARRAIRLGLLDEARAALAAAERAGALGAAYLNLRGVLDELRRDWKAAKRHYGRAIRADRGFQAAQQNMRRLYELDTFGRCAENIALGDEGPALMRLPGGGGNMPRPRPAGTPAGATTITNGSIWNASPPIPGSRVGTGEGTSLPARWSARLRRWGGRSITG
jgi:hypothetical protein